MTLQAIAEKMIQNSKNMETLAAQLIDALTAECAKSSQGAVATKLGVSAPYLSDILKGNRAAGEAMARRVVDAFGKGAKS